MAGLLEQHQEIAQPGRNLHGLDVGARHHDVLDTHFAQTQDVVEHRALARREGFRTGFGLGQRVGDFLAQRGAVALPEQADNTLEQGRPGRRRLARYAAGAGTRTGSFFRLRGSLYGTAGVRGGGSL